MKTPSTTICTTVIKAILFASMAFVASTGDTLLPVIAVQTVNVQAVITNNATPSDVTNLQGVYIATNPRIELQWTPPSSPFTSYELFVRTVGSGSYSPVISISASEHSYTYQPAAPDLTYEFLIKVISGTLSSGGVNTFVSTQSHATTPTPALPAGESYLLLPPTITSITGHDNLITLQWKEPNELLFPVKKYYLYKTTEFTPFPSEPYAVTDGTLLTYTDTAVVRDVVYRYFVTAEDIGGMLSGNSGTVSFMIQNTPPQSKITAIPPLQNKSVFPIEMTFYDANSVASVDLYYSKDGGPATYYGTYPVSGTSRSQIIFFNALSTGGDGVYTFYTSALNSSGIRELAPINPDTSSTIDTTPPDIPEGVVFTKKNNTLYQADIILKQPNDSVEMILGAHISPSLGESSLLTIGNWQEFMNSFHFLYAEPGIKSISVTYRDQAGNISPTLFLTPNFTDEDAVFHVTPTDTPTVNDLYPFAQKPKTGNQEATAPSSEYGADRDSDGVRDIDEVILYHTSPSDLNSAPENVDIFTTNIKDYDAFMIHSQILFFGTASPEQEISIYMKKNNAITLLGSTQSSILGKYDTSLQSLSEAGEYEVLFFIKNAKTGKNELFKREHIILRKGISPLNIIFEDIGGQKISDVQTTKEFSQKSKEEQIHMLDNKQRVFFTPLVEGTSPSISLSLLSLGVAPSEEHPMKVTYMWDTSHGLADGFISSIFLTDQQDFYITSPVPLSDGSHTLSIYIADSDGNVSPLRTLLFTTTSSPLHTPMLDTCLQLIQRPDFWLWMVIAFLLGIFSTLLFRPKLTEKEEESKEEYEKESECEETDPTTTQRKATTKKSKKD